MFLLTPDIAYGELVLFLAIILKMVNLVKVPKFDASVMLCLNLKSSQNSPACLQLSSR